MLGTFSRTKDEYLELVKAVRKDFGDKINIDITMLKQNDKFETFVLPLRQDLCQLFLQRLPRSFNTPDGIQRAYKSAKISEIKSAAADPFYSAPGSIVGTVNISDRKWVHVEWFSGKRTGQLVVDLKDMEKRLHALAPDAKGALDEEKFKIGYMIDAHHRTEGHYQAGRNDLEMAAVLFIDIPQKQMARVFSQVNDKQEKPSPTHTLAMRQMAGMLGTAEKLAVEIAQCMNDDPKSILYHRIKCFDGPVPKSYPKTYVNMKTFSELLRREVINHIPDDSSVSTKGAVIEEYFKGWKAAFPEAWEDDKQHVLVKAMGFHIMCQVFSKIFDVTQFKFHKAAPKEAQFKKVIEALHGMKLEFKDVKTGEITSIAMDWQSSQFGGYSSGKGVNYVKEEINKFYTNSKMTIAKAE
jgi:DGQHR domain-containing protein